MVAWEGKAEKEMKTSLVFNLDQLHPTGYCHQEYMRRSIQKGRTIFRYCGANSETPTSEFVAALSPVEQIYVGDAGNDRCDVVCLLTLATGEDIHVWHRAHQCDTTSSSQGIRMKPWAEFWNRSGSCSRRW